MSEASKDTTRAKAAAAAMIDERDPLRDSAQIMVTIEHTVSVVLLLLYDHDPRKAAHMLNEGLLQGVENRLALYRSKQGGKP